MVVIVPSRGRPTAALELAGTFQATCALNTRPVFAVDADDPTAEDYQEVVRQGLGSVIVADHTSMVDALNRRAAGYANLEEDLRPTAIGFMGDDHRPRSVGWDAAYLAVLAERPGFVYGNDLVQRANLPTQIAISTSVVAALGHMAPGCLTHLYVDNYWRHLGQAAGCITYLPDVVVEHLHPVAGTAPVDDGYLRVNAPEMYARDRAAFQAYMAEHGQREVLAVRESCVAVAR
ncbi:hypothetical protein ACFWYW_55815 [Nonomuraea sp. NPDC059023]|uniref:hypothetical protein n=1 Tax=unclassified Nonomuraea TaxID=2593643 RepID=UPI0036844432